MSLRLVSRAADPHRFADHPVSRLRLEPSRQTSGTRLRRPSRPTTAAREREHEDLVMEALAPDAPSLDEPSLDEPSAEEAREQAPDHAAARAQAEAEDVALVRLAAARLAVALREVPMLLRGAQGARRGDALARCTAKGWITLHGDSWAASHTFRVTPEGYRAAGLRPPPFAA